MVGKTTAKAELPTRDSSLGSALELEIIPSLLEAFTQHGIFTGNAAKTLSNKSTAGKGKAGRGNAAKSKTDNLIPGREAREALVQDAVKQGHRRGKPDTRDALQTGIAGTPRATHLNGVSTTKTVNLPSLKSTPRTNNTPRATPARQTENTRAAASQTERPRADRLSKARIDHWIGTDEFALMVMADEGQQAQSLVNSLRDAGIPDEAILLDLLAPTGAVLGRLWEEDLSSFAEITVGVCRLHSILRALHPADRRSLEKDAHGGRALLFTAPGEQHSFGLIMISELLFRSGWCVDVQIEPGQPTILDSLSRQWFEFVGISLSGETHIDSTARLIAEIKQKSCNPSVAVVMGGTIFHDNPDLCSQLGADNVVLSGADVAKMTEQYIPAQKVM